MTSLSTGARSSNADTRSEHVFTLRRRFGHRGRSHPAATGAAGMVRAQIANNGEPAVTEHQKYAPCRRPCDPANVKTCCLEPDEKVIYG
jgi:hypothetical protein